MVPASPSSTMHEKEQCLVICHASCRRQGQWERGCVGVGEGGGGEGGGQEDLN